MARWGDKRPLALKIRTSLPKDVHKKLRTEQVLKDVTTQKWVAPPIESSLKMIHYQNNTFSR